MAESRIAGTLPSSAGSSGRVTGVAATAIATAAMAAALPAPELAGAGIVAGASSRAALNVTSLSRRFADLSRAVNASKPKIASAVARIDVWS